MTSEAKNFYPRNFNPRSTKRLLAYVIMAGSSCVTHAAAEIVYTSAQDKIWG
jgi:hypothetical protein